MSNTDDAAGPIRSVDRALAVLDVLATHGTAGVTEIAKELDVHKSTAFRLVATLEQRQFVEQLAERGKYRLGFGIVRLAGATTARLDLPRESKPVCAELAAECGETVNVAILDSGTATNVTQEHGHAAITVRNWIGQRTPLHATSSGKILLAWAEANAVSDALASTKQKFTARTITANPALLAELDRVRERGWASCTEELEVGLNAVAVPIRGADGKVAAAVSVSGPSYRLTTESFPDIAKKLQAGADRISSRIGYIKAA
ncbi:MAG TPA: IclR family transcriptional regulator [Pseudonocardiaceae bacterium]|nr:IclR family transcriptional regulator [Pseudonocardiaceae bacterium]